MRLRYGVTADEATHREILELALREEAADLAVGDEGTSDDVVAEPPSVLCHHASVLPDVLEEERIATAAEQDAMQVV